LPLEIGLGGYDVKIQDSLTGKIFNDKKGGIIPIGIGVQPVYKPWKWVGVAFLLGYRIVLENNSNQNFNGWYYSFGLTVDLRQIIRDTKYYLIKKKHYNRVVKRTLKS